MTEKQAAALAVPTDYYRHHGLPPTQHELASALSVSQNTVSVMLMRLHQKGLLLRVRSSYLPANTEVVTTKSADDQ